MGATQRSLILRWSFWWEEKIFFAAMPLGLNTVVFPEAYGGNPETGASMALISHTLCIVSIPLMYALMTLLFGPCQIL